MREAKWYAVMKDENDTDWGYGSFRKKEAAKMVRDLKKKGYDNAYIEVVITIDGIGTCVEKIYDVKGL